MKHNEKTKKPAIKKGLIRRRAAELPDAFRVNSLKQDKGSRCYYEVKVPDDEPLGPFLTHGEASEFAQELHGATVSLLFCPSQENLRATEMSLEDALAKYRTAYNAYRGDSFLIPIGEKPRILTSPIHRYSPEWLSHAHPVYLNPDEYTYAEDWASDIQTWIDEAGDVIDLLENLLLYLEDPEVGD
jgi:hypothetical protein